MILRFPPGWGVRAIVDNALGVTQSAFEIIDYSLMTRLVRAGFGTTLVPASAMYGEPAEGLRAIALDDPRVRWNLSAAVSADPPADRRHEDPARRAHPGTPRRLTGSAEQAVASGWLRS